MKRSPKETLKRMFGSRFRAGSYAAFAAAVVIAIVIIVNLMVNSLPSTYTEIDLTSGGLFSLSDQTRRIVTSLDKDVNLYLLATTGNEDSTITSLLDRYASLSSHIRVSYIDPAVKPTFLENYELTSSRVYANSVLVECGSTYRLVGYDQIYVTEYSMDYYSYSYTSTTSFDGENALTNAIHFVSSEDLPRVYVLTGHGEAALSDSVTAMLEQDNMTYESLSLLTLEAVPEDATAVVINVPSSDLSEDEAAMLTAYLSDGGSVVLLTGTLDAAAMPHLLSVTEAMGVTAGEGVIIEGDRSMCLSRYQHYLLPSVAEHDVTEALNASGYYILVPLAQPIVKVNGSSASVTSLLTTSAQSYSKLAGVGMTTTEREDGDVDGPFDVGIISEMNGGKLFWVTSPYLLDSGVDGMVSGGNSNLVLNVLDWMGGQEDAISIRAKSLDSETLTVPASQSSLWSVIMIGVIPAAFIVLGIIVTIRRKRR